MIITDIVEMSKTKVRICIDNGVNFALYKGELEKFSIRQDGELSQDFFDMIMGEVLPKRAKLRCMNLLKSRDYTEYQLEMKLRQGFYPDEIIDEAIAYVASYGYVDDFRYAQSYIRCASRTKSRRQIENSLLQKGISKEKIDRIYAQCIDEDSITEEEELINRLLEKKHFDRQNATYEECRKMVGFLYRKGFVLDKIYKVIDSY